MAKRVLIIGSVKLPIPAVKGGAVPNLIEELICQQEKIEKIDLSVCSLWDQNAYDKSKEYAKTNFIWARIPSLIYQLDGIVRWILRSVIKKDRLLSAGFIFQIIWYTFFVSRVLSKNSYDAVIFENSVQMLFSLKLMGNMKKYKDKYYIHMHSVPRKYSGARKEFEKAKKIICISEYVAREIQKDPRIHTSPSQYEIMYNCIDTDIFTHIDDCEKIKEIKEKYGIPEGKKLILFAGRLCKDKGIEVLFEAFKMLNMSDTLLVIVGSNFYKSGIVSPYEEQLKRISESFKEKIIFTGYVDYSDMPQIYNIADVVVLPSMWEEPAGMTIIEAMSCRCPVITTVSGGIPEYTGENNCILLERNEALAQKIAAEIKRILDEPEYGVSIGEKSEKRASQFNVEYYYEQFLNILGEKI